jgi:hypothetical protein
MGLTSKLFLVLLGLATLAAGGLTVWLWPRLAGPGARALAGRLGLLAAVQLAGLLTVAALANAAFGFYASWGDLFGVASQRYKLTSAVAVPSNANAAQIQGNAATQASPKGEVLTSTLLGLRSGITADLHVYLPPQYLAASASHRYFPAVVVDANAVSDATGLASALQNSAGGSPAVVVIVDGAGGRDIPCSYQAGPTGALFWGQDLRTAIAAQFRVRLNAASWGALSTGSDDSCAAALALEDAGRYSAAAVVGPWPRDGSPGTAADPAWWLRTYPAPPVRLLLAGLGKSPESVLGPVHPPLQVTATGTVTEYSAVNWLAQALQNGGSA